MFAIEELKKATVFSVLVFIHAHGVLGTVEHALLLLASLVGVSSRVVRVSGAFVLIHSQGMLGIVHDTARSSFFVMGVLAAASFVGNFLSGGFVAVGFDTTEMGHDRG